MQRFPADRDGGGASRGEATAPVVDRALVLASCRQVIRRTPAGAAVSAVVELPIFVACALLPGPLSWVGWPAAAILGAAAALAVGPGRAGSLIAGLRAAGARARDVLVVGALEAAAIVALTLPAVLLWLLGVGAFGLYLIVVALVVSGSRFALALPALILRDSTPIEALELSWALVDGVAVEVGALYAVVAALALGPAIALASVAAALGWPAVLGALASAVALALTGPLLPLVFAEALDHLERRRRALDPHFGRP